MVRDDLKNELLKRINALPPECQMKVDRFVATLQESQDTAGAREGSRPKAG